MHAVELAALAMLVALPQKVIVLCSVLFSS